jgi:hypothetical protein
MGQLSRRYELDFVVDCGADPTGAVDCAAALNKAFAIFSALAANPKLPRQTAKLWIPPGLYTLRTTPTFWIFTSGSNLSKLIWQGAGDASILQLDMGGAGVGPFIANTDFVELNDFVVVGGQLGTVTEDASIIMVVGSFWETSVRNVRFLGLNTQFGSSWQGRRVIFDSSEFSGCGTQDAAHATCVCLCPTTFKHGQFFDLPVLNGFAGAQLEKTAVAENEMIIDLSTATVPQLSYIELSDMLFDEGCVHNLIIKGSVVAPIPHVVLDDVFVNGPGLLPFVPYAIHVEDVSLLEVRGMGSALGAGAGSGNPFPLLDLFNVSRAELSIPDINVLATFAKVAADAACGYVEIDQPSPLLAIASLAVRTLVKTRPITAASDENTGLPPRGQVKLKLSNPAATSGVATFPMVEGSFSGRVSVVGRLVEPGAGVGVFTVGDYFGQDNDAKLKTVAGTTTLMDGAPFAVATKDACFVGTTVTLGASTDKLTVTVDISGAASGAGTIADFDVMLVPENNVMSAFLPTSLAGLLLWTRADQGITIGTGVAQWNDLSGSGDANRNFVQATASMQPVLNGANFAFNGQATLDLTAADFMQMASAGNWSVSPVAEPYTLIMVADTTTPAVAQWFMVDAAGGPVSYLYDNAAGNFNVTGGAGTISSTTAPSATAKIFVVEVNNPNSTIRVSDLTAEATGTLGGAPTLSALRIGALSAVNFPVQGSIAEVMVFGRILSAGELAILCRGYLGNRYAIAVGP